MSLYFVSFDLGKNLGDYQLFFNELKMFGSIKVLDNLWSFHASNTSISELREYFKQFLKYEDKLVVIEAKDWNVYNINLETVS